MQQPNVTPDLATGPVPPLGQPLLADQYLAPFDGNFDATIQLSPSAVPGSLDQVYPRGPLVEGFFGKPERAAK